MRYKETKKKRTLKKGKKQETHKRLAYSTAQEMYDIKKGEFVV